MIDANKLTALKKRHLPDEKRRELLKKQIAMQVVKPRSKSKKFELNRKAAKHPFDRINWGDKIKFYANGTIASTSTSTKDNLVFSYDALQRIVEINKHTTYPVFLDGDNENPIGIVKLSGLKPVDEAQVLLSGFTFVTAKDIAERLEEYFPLMCVTNVKSSMQGNKKIVKKCDLKYVILKHKKTYDDYCRFTNIYKDQDIDKRLSE